MRLVMGGGGIGLPFTFCIAAGFLATFCDQMSSALAVVSFLHVDGVNVFRGWRGGWGGVYLVYSAAVEPVGVGVGV